MDIAQDILKTSQNCADIIWQEMLTRRGFIELLATIDPPVKQEIIQSWGQVVAWSIREFLKTHPTAGSES